VAVPLVQLTRSPSPSGTVGAAPGNPVRKPSWLKVRAPGGPNYAQIKGLMRELELHTVCEEARCPNVGDCWEHKAATFMILGDVCTRNCTYCAVSHGTPKAFDPLEPVRLAEAVARMELQHVVITSVDRDDLPNGGAEAFAGCILEIRRRMPDTTVEVLIPDFKGSERALAIVMEARPDILNHNLETAERLYRLARPGGRYARALELLARARQMRPDGLTKSGVMSSSPTSTLVSPPRSPPSQSPPMSPDAAAAARGRVSAARPSTRSSPRCASSASAAARRGRRLPAGRSWAEATRSGPQSHGKRCRCRAPIQTFPRSSQGLLQSFEPITASQPTPPPAPSA